MRGSRVGPLLSGRAGSTVDSAAGSALDSARADSTAGSARAAWKRLERWGAGRSFPLPLPAAPFCSPFREVAHFSFLLK